MRVKCAQKKKLRRDCVNEKKKNRGNRKKKWKINFYITSSIRSLSDGKLNRKKIGDRLELGSYQLNEIQT